MDLMEKLKVLSAAAKYDVSCSSSGSERKNAAGGIGNALILEKGDAELGFLFSATANNSLNEFFIAVES